MRRIVNGHKYGSVTYATWNPADKAAGITLSGSDLIATASDADIYAVRSTIGKSSGKWYFEYTVTAAPANSTSYGIKTSGEANTVLVGDTTGGYGYNDVGQKKYNAIDTAYGAAPANGTVIGVLLNMDDLEISFRHNNTSYGVAFTVTAATYFAAMSSGYGANQVTANFGASAFVYSVPAGYNSGLYT
jgi:hypothetical protein